MSRVIRAVVVVLALAMVPAAAGSPASAQTSPAVQDYVASVYDLFLGRQPTAAEIDRWDDIVAAGRRTELTRDLAASDEWAGVRVNELYQRILGRDADAAGRAYWVSKIRSGTTLESVAAGFYGSDEYYRRHGGTASTFIGRLYTDLLGRAADEQGHNYWIGQLSAGMTRSSVATNFYGSIESRRDRVTALYSEILNRAPEAAGMDYWSGQIVSLGDIALAAHLAASEEYYRRATGTNPPSTTGTITGRLIDGATGNGIEGYTVFVGDAADGRPVATSNSTGPDGRYVVNGVPAGSHDLLATRIAGGTPPYLPEYYKDAYGAEDAQSVTVTAGGTLTIDFQLSSGGTIAGTVVSDRTGQAAAGPVCVAYSSADNTRSGVVGADSGGGYVANGLRPGQYFLIFSNCSDRVYEVYDNAPNRSTATLVDVRDLTTTRIDVGIAD